MQGSWVYEHGNVTYNQYASKQIDDFNTMNTYYVFSDNNKIGNNKYIKQYKNIWRNALRLHEVVGYKVDNILEESSLDQSSSSNTLIYPRFMNAVHIPVSIYASNTINVLKYTFILHNNMLFDKHVYCAIHDSLKLAVDSTYFFGKCIIADITTNLLKHQQLGKQDQLYATNICGDAVWCQDSSKIMHRILGWQYPIPKNTACNHKDRKFLLIDINDIDERLNIYKLMYFVAKLLKLAICTNRILYLIPLAPNKNRKDEQCNMLSCYIQDITSCQLSDDDINNAFPIYTKEDLSQSQDRKVINILSSKLFDHTCPYPLSNTIYEKIANKAIFETLEYAMIAPFIRHVFRLKPYVIYDIQQGHLYIYTDDVIEIYHLYHSIFHLSFIYTLNICTYIYQL